MNTILKGTCPICKKEKVKVFTNQEKQPEPIRCDNCWVNMPTTAEYT